MNGGSPPSIQEEPAEGGAGDTDQVLPPGVHPQQSLRRRYLACSASAMSLGMAVAALDMKAETALVPNLEVHDKRSCCLLTLTLV